MNTLTKAARIAPSDSLSPSPGESGFSLGGLASGIVDSLHALGIVIAYLAGRYGDDSRGAGSAD